MGLFDTVSDQTIRDGGCTDIYFVRTEEALAQDGINPKVAMEVTATALPDPWAVFCGLSDVIALLQGMPVTVDALPEGTVFYPHEPVLRITGRYRDFCRYETTILGFLCHASGIATAAAQIRYIASGRPVYSFGSRRQHPAIAPMIERFIKDGRVVKQSGMQEARLRVLGQVKDLPQIQSLLKKRDPASLMNR